MNEIVLGSMIPLKIGERSNRGARDVHGNWHPVCHRVVREATKAEWLECCRAYGKDFDPADPFIDYPYHYRVQMD